MYMLTKLLINDLENLLLMGIIADFITVLHMIFSKSTFLNSTYLAAEYSYSSHQIKRIPFRSREILSVKPPGPSLNSYGTAFLQRNSLCTRTGRITSIMACQLYYFVHQG